MELATLLNPIDQRELPFPLENQPDIPASGLEYENLPQRSEIERMECLLPRMLFHFNKVKGLPRLPRTCKPVIRWTDYGLSILLPRDYSDIGIQVALAVQYWIAPDLFSVNPAMKNCIMQHFYKGGVVFTSKRNFVAFFDHWNLNRNEVGAIYDKYQNKKNESKSNVVVRRSTHDSSVTYIV